MIAAIATPSGGGPLVDLSYVHEHQLLRTAAYSLKSLLRTNSGSMAAGSSSSSSSSGGMATTTTGHGGGLLLNPLLPNLPTIEAFIFNIITALDIKTAVLVTALIYVERLSQRLPESATGTADTPYRIFLASLLLADKFWSDSAVPVKSLVTATGGVFAHREIASMERAMIKLLGFNLFVSADQIHAHARKIGFAVPEKLEQ
ncbi:PHO85 cyclin-1 [Coemansia sp. RSA 1200]|nr:PHO85 cyclin-1 [Coemansia sp. RSA 1200]